MSNLRDIFNQNYILVLTVITVIFFIFLVFYNRSNKNIHILSKILIITPIILIIFFLVLEIIFKITFSKLIINIVSPIIANIKKRIIIYSLATIGMGIIINIYTKLKKIQTM